MAPGAWAALTAAVRECAFQCDALPDDSVPALGAPCCGPGCALRSVTADSGLVGCTRACVLRWFPDGTQVVGMPCDVAVIVIVVVPVVVAGTCHAWWTANHRVAVGTTNPRLLTVVAGVAVWWWWKGVGYAFLPGLGCECVAPSEWLMERNEE